MLRVSLVAVASAGRDKKCQKAFLNKGLYINSQYMAKSKVSLIFSDFFYHVNLEILCLKQNLTDRGGSFATGFSTVVEHLPHHLRVEGLSPVFQYS